MPLIFKPHFSSRLCIAHLLWLPWASELSQAWVTEIFLHRDVWGEAGTEAERDRDREIRERGEEGRREGEGKRGRKEYTNMLLICSPDRWTGTDNSPALASWALGLQTCDPMPVPSFLLNKPQGQCWLTFPRISVHSQACFLPSSLISWSLEGITALLEVFETLGS